MSICRGAFWKLAESPARIGNDISLEAVYRDKSDQIGEDR
jgi:hypothetical protein